MANRQEPLLHGLRFDEHWRHSQPHFEFPRADFDALVRTGLRFRPAISGQFLKPTDLEIFSFRTHKPAVNIAAVCGVKEMNGEKPPRHLNGKLAGAKHEKHQRAVPALAGRKVARTGLRDTSSYNQIQSHRMGWAALRVRRDVVTSRSARIVLLQAR